jgi:hypothetical protein
MLNRVKKSISMVLLPMLASSALGQDITAEEELPVVPRYTVEMIIFSYAQDVSAGTEVFMPDQPPPLEPGMEGELIDGLMQDEVEEPPVPEEPIAEESLEEEAIEDDERPYEIVMLPEEDFALLDIFERLDNLDAYIPIMHFGWTQPTYPREETEARPLSSFMTPPEGLEGDLSLYLSRYLHLGINLQLDAPVEEETEDAFILDDFGDSAVVTYPVRYRLEEDRIFRNGELRYFDHPKFGVLAKITRVEEEEVEEFEEELLGFDGE